MNSKLAVIGLLAVVGANVQWGVLGAPTHPSDDSPNWNNYDKKFMGHTFPGLSLYSPLQRAYERKVSADMDEVDPVLERAPKFDSWDDSADAAAASRQMGKYSERTGRAHTPEQEAFIKLARIQLEAAKVSLSSLPGGPPLAAVVNDMVQTNSGPISPGDLKYLQPLMPLSFTDTVRNGKTAVDFDALKTDVGLINLASKLDAADPLRGHVVDSYDMLVSDMLAAVNRAPVFDGVGVYYVSPYNINWFMDSCAYNLASDHDRHGIHVGTSAPLWRLFRKHSEGVFLGDPLKLLVGTRVENDGQYHFTAERSVALVIQSSCQRYTGLVNAHPELALQELMLPFSKRSTYTVMHSKAVPRRHGNGFNLYLFLREDDPSGCRA